MESHSHPRLHENDQFYLNEFMENTLDSSTKKEKNHFIVITDEITTTERTEVSTPYSANTRESSNSLLVAL